MCEVGVVCMHVDVTYGGISYGCAFLCVVCVWMCVDYIYGTSLKIAEPFYFLFYF